MKKLILASQSPRRRELLAQLGYQFTCCPADIDETVQLHESPKEYVERLALEKSACIAKEQAETTLVLGSDTCVVYQNCILGKPENLAQATDHLTRLSGNTHQVLTAIAVVQGQFSKAVVVCTDVTFKTLTTQEIINYWHTGEPQDKAGSYGIQGIAGQFVKHICGSYSAVVGLPLYETAQLLAEFSCPTPVHSS
ncbi:Maf family protein [Thalassotalea castellviae]|uniref:dTTP/UTP pyrophosphatase n=1 Tax=Thalassotalea castellviae TaxID=3075612 RepID=A0ABU3A190_9GAMM|nr:Maf family protein [Thalassotalea sp. W431]MDT0603317.1 Maf family protein [Thalassotalea sp. W431]